jgi:hypothetical protein
MTVVLGACAVGSSLGEGTASTDSALASGAGLSFSSTGDPHEQTGDGFPFENQKRGVFTAIKSYSAIVKDGSPSELMLMKKQEPCNVGVTCNTRVGIYAGGSRIKAYADGTLWLNGTQTTMATNAVLQLQKPDGSLAGGAIRRTDPTPGLVVYDVKSPVGDTIQLQVYVPGYISIFGTISSSRKSERVRGSLGCIDADTSQDDDLCKRFVTSLNEISVNGQETFYPLTSDGVNAFLEAWRSVAADCTMADVPVDTAGHCAL